MSRSTTKSAPSVNVDPFVNLPCPSFAHAALITAFVAQAQELLISAYSPLEGTPEEKRAAALAVIQGARPTFTGDDKNTPTDICFVLRKVTDKCVAEAADLKDRASIALASEASMGLQRKLRANLTADEIIEAGLSDTVSVPLTTVAKAECFQGWEVSDILPRLTVGRKEQDGKSALRGLGYECFKKGDTYMVRVPFVPADQAPKAHTDAQPEAAAA